MTTDELDEAIQSLAQTPLLLESALSQLSPEVQRCRNLDEFSALENVCHLRDIEIEGYGQRLKRILQEDKPALADIDGTRLAIERDYNNQDGKSALKAFCDARNKNVKLLKDLNPDQMAREGELEGVGVIRLEKLIEMMVEHDQGHLAELATITRRVQRRSEPTAF